MRDIKELHIMLYNDSSWEVLKGEFNDDAVRVLISKTSESLLLYNNLCELMLTLQGSNTVDVTRYVLEEYVKQFTYPNLDVYTIDWLVTMVYNEFSHAVSNFIPYKPHELQTLALWSYDFLGDNYADKDGVVYIKTTLVEFFNGTCYLCELVYVPREELNSDGLIELCKNGNRDDEVLAILCKED